MINVPNCHAARRLTNPYLLFVLLLLMLVGSAAPINAYELLGYKWPQASTTFSVDIPGENGLWNDSLNRQCISGELIPNFSTI